MADNDHRYNTIPYERSTHLEFVRDGSFNVAGIVIYHDVFSFYLLCVVSVNPNVAQLQTIHNLYHRAMLETWIVFLFVRSIGIPRINESP